MSLEALLKHLNPVVRGWCMYFRHGVSSATFGYLHHYTWWRPLDGCATDTRAWVGERSSAGFLPDQQAAQQRTGPCSTTRRRSPSSDTATAGTRSQHHGHTPRHTSTQQTPAWHRWRARCGESRSPRRGGHGKRTRGNAGTARPWPTQHQTPTVAGQPSEQVAERECVATPSASTTGCARWSRPLGDPNLGRHPGCRWLWWSPPPSATDRGRRAGGHRRGPPAADVRCDPDGQPRLALPVLFSTSTATARCIWVAPTDCHRRPANCLARQGPWMHPPWL